MTNGHKVIFLAVLVSGVVGSIYLASTVSQTQTMETSSSVECPAATGYVQDCANVLTEQQKKELTDILSRYDRDTTNQIAVVTIDSLNGQDIESYSIKLAEKLAPGTKEKDNGIIFIIAKNDRKMRIEVGHGLEGELTDAEAGAIIRSVVAPKFKTGDFNAGIVNGVDSIIVELTPFSHDN